MRRRVNAARAAAHHRHADVGELIRQFARGLDAVMRRLPRADHRHGIFVLRGQFAFDVKHERRIINLAQQRGIIFIRRNQNVAAEIGNAFQFARRGQRIFPNWKFLRPFPRRCCGRAAVRIWRRREFLARRRNASATCRARTGPTPSIMFNATNASRESMTD